MKPLYIIVPALVAITGYVYMTYTPANGWGSVFAECKHCSCSHKKQHNHSDPDIAPQQHESA